MIIKKVKWLGNLEVETNCKCKKPDWVTGFVNTQMAKKGQFFLQCDSCKEYAYKDDGSIIIVELVKEIGGHRGEVRGIRLACILGGIW